MTYDELVALLTNAKTIGIFLLGGFFTIKSWGNGKYSVEDKNKNSFSTFNSPGELLENYTVMNMSFGSLTPWMNVATVV